MDIGTLINYILYALSGFCFGIFASRYSVLSCLKIKERLAASGLSGLITTLPQLLFLLVSFFIFPAWFITRTPIGGFFYCAILIYFFSQGYRTYIKNR